MTDRPVLSPDFLRELALDNPLGLRLSADDVQAWWELVWPLFRERRYTHRRRAIVSWWSRVREEDIERALARRQRIADEAEAARLEALAEKINAEPAPIAADRFSRVARR